MRKSLLLAIFAAFTIFANAQIEKGKWIASLGFEFGKGNFKSSQTNRDQNATSTDIGVALGYMLSRKISVGVGSTYSHDKYETHFSSDNYYISNATSFSYNLYSQGFYSTGASFFYSPQ